MTTADEKGYEALQRQVEYAVEQEDRKRRYGIALFLVLALVPLAIGGYVLFQGMDDNTWIKKTAEAAAISEIDTIRPILKRVDAVDSVLPEIRNIATALPEQDRRIELLEERQTGELQRIEQRISHELDSFHHTAQQVEHLQKELPKFQASIDGIDNQTREFMELEKERNMSIERLKKNLDALVSKVDRRETDRILEFKVKELEKDFSILKKQQDGSERSAIGRKDLDKISEQLTSIQNTLKTQSRNIVNLRQRLEKLENKSTSIRPPRPPRRSMVQ